MGSGWPGDVIITDDVMSLSRPNTLFFQPNKARLLGIFRAFLRASIVPMGMDTIPGISASIRDGLCILQWLYDLRIWGVLRGSRLQKIDDVMSLSRPNTLFFQPNKARLLGFFGRSSALLSYLRVWIRSPGSRLQFGTGYAFFSGFMTSEYGEF